MGNRIPPGFFKRDRLAALLAQMTLAGAVDWATANPADRDWQLQFRLRLRAFRHSLDVAQSQREFQITLAGLGTDDADWYNKQRKEAEKRSLRIDQLVRPWHYADEELVENQPTLHEQYVQVWGDPNDPEYKKKIDETIANILAGKSND